MFICTSGHTSLPRAKLVLLVTETRAVVYRDGNHGREIVTEKPYCTDCAEALKLRALEGRSAHVTP